MKVLGIGGSPRPGGNTEILLDEVLRGAASKGAEVKKLNACRLQISACLHCDKCVAEGRCAVMDDMQIVYREMEAADRLVLASPIQFLGVTAQLKALIDRCQALWVRKYILKIPPLGDNRPRKGLFIAVGGRSSPANFEPARAMIRLFYRVLDVEYAGELFFPGIDAKGEILNHPDALKQAFAAGEKLVEQSSVPPVK